MARLVVFGIPVFALVGALGVVTTAVVMLFGSWIAPFEAHAIVGHELEPWGDGFLLGTDSQGRDVFSLLVLGARNTVWTAVEYAVPAFLLGGVMGLASGRLGGWIDRILAWLFDSIMSVPPFIWFVLVVAVYLSAGDQAIGRSYAIASLAVVFGAPVYRLVRGLVSSLRADSAVSGAGRARPGFRSPPGRWVCQVLGSVDIHLRAKAMATR